jgi:murein DD-endopeptidase MepM/ murein hydrolase activator NlpD
MQSNWKQIMQKKAEGWLSRYSTPPLLKEAGWKALVFVAQCGASNPISFALRPLAVHGRLKAGVGAILAVLAIYGAFWSPLSVLARPDIGGQWEVATLGEGEVKLTTVEAVVDPLPQIEVSQGYWLLHPGLDMRAPIGTPINPVMTGRVATVEQGRWGGYGKHVVVDHNNGYTSLYAHMSKVEAEVGRVVGTDTVIGEVGSTGRSSGPHLHLEITENGRKINPAPFLGIR